MKKSFKKAIAILLAVMMVVCAFPMSAFAADEAKPNINIRLGAFTANATNPHNYTVTRTADILTYSGINSTALDYTGTAISGYGVGDYFTATVVLENVSQIAAAQIAVKYSDTIEPAGALAGRSGFYTGTSSTTKFLEAGEAIAAQSGDALYNTAHTVGEMSYAADGVMHADFAVQDGREYATSSTGYFYLATFAFKIVKEGDITFSMVDDATEEDAFFLGTLENGGQVEEYVTFVETENEGSKGLGFMGKDADGEPVAPTTEYTITFIDAEGATISTGTYAEGATVTAPELPETTKDADNHYTYAWDVTPAATATANATYTVVKTPAAHTWNTGVETIPATEETEGEMTYTCTVCSQTKTEPIKKLEPSHTHEYVWVYNNDATYTSSSVFEDGTATGTCSCGDIQTKTIAGTGLLRANSASVVLGAAVELKTRFSKSRQAPFDETYLIITFDGKDYRIDEKEAYSATLDQFSFDKIKPEYFAENVDLTMYGVKDGIVCKGHTVNYSIKTYSMNQLKSTNVKLNTLLVEMLYYGEAARVYGKRDDLASPIAELSAEQKALHTDYVPSYVKLTNPTYETNPGTNCVTWSSATMKLEGKVIPQINLRVVSGDINDYDFYVTVAGETIVLNAATDEENFEKGSVTSTYTAYKLYVTSLKADQFREAIDVVAKKKDGTVVSNTLRYSVESYTSASAYTSSADLRVLVDQMLRYGRADAVYTEKAVDYK